MLQGLAKQHQAKTRDIFLLALNYHSVDSGDFGDEDKKILRNKLLDDWAPINNKLISNGHKSVHLLQIKSLEDAHDVAYLVLNSKDKLKAKYSV